MTFSDSIPLAKQLAERQLQKGFDVEAFLILCELSKMDTIPESDVDNHISDIGKIFQEYYYNPNTETLDRFCSLLISTISEIYHTLPSMQDKELLKSKIHQLNNLFD